MWPSQPSKSCLAGRRLMQVVKQRDKAGSPQLGFGPGCLWCLRMAVDMKCWTRTSSQLLLRGRFVHPYSLPFWDLGAVSPALVGAKALNSCVTHNAWTPPMPLIMSRLMVVSDKVLFASSWHKVSSHRIFSPRGTEHWTCFVGCHVNMAMHKHPADTFKCKQGILCSDNMVILHDKHRANKKM